jgi:hypothetical protein
MKTAASMLFGVLVFVLRMDLAAAAVITVRVTGHVTTLVADQPLITQMYSGEPVTATYTYDTATGPYAPLSYRPDMPPATASVTIGPFSIQSVPPSQPPTWGQQPPLQIQMSLPGTPGSGWSSFDVEVINAPLLKDGVPVDGHPFNAVNFSFNDPAGQWPVDSNLPTGAPALSTLALSNIHIQSGISSTIDIQIDSVALVPTTFEVSPASGNFVAQQHFDASLLVPAGMAQITNVQASVNGNPIPALRYPGTCTLAPATTLAAILCPDASDSFDPAALLPGPTVVDWQVTLADGTVMTKTVTWNRVH